MDLRDFKALLSGVQEKRGGGCYAKCPAHEDKRRSLVVDSGRDGRILAYCHARCSVEAITEALGITVADLYPDDERHDAGPGGKVAAGKRGPRPKASRPKGSVRAAPRPHNLGPYVYTDEEGRPLYRNVRKGEGKDKTFWHERWTGTGWEKGLGNAEHGDTRRGDARRVPYNLPALLAAIEAGETVLLVEGEKDVHSAEEIGYTATTVGGAANWRPVYAEHFAGAHVVVVPDNDAAGKALALDAALDLLPVAASVRVVRLGVRGGGDLTDWLDAGGTAEEFAEAVHAAHPLGEGSAPAKFRKFSVQSSTGSEPPPWIPFPTSALPVRIRDIVRAGAKAIVVDEANVAMHALPVAASAVGNAYRVFIKGGWDEPAVLWSIVIALSGVGKSPAWKLACDPVFALERAAKEAYKLEKADYQERKRQYDLLTQKQKRDEEPPEKPAHRRFRVDDVTVESIGHRTSENTRGLLVAVDEGSGWINSMDRYASTGGGDLPKWLSLHDGRPVVIDRKTGDTPVLYIDRPAVSITCTIQPETFRDAMKPIHFGSGFVPRLLLCEPPIQLREWTDAHVDRGVRDAYTRCIRALYDLPESEETVSLSAEARGLFVDFYNENAQTMNALLGADGTVRSVLAKMEARAARIALVFHLADLAAGGLAPLHPEPITGNAMARAINVTKWLRYETLRLFQCYGYDSGAGLDRDERLARRLPGTFGREDVMRLWGVKYTQAYNIIKKLTEYNYAEQVEHGAYARLVEPAVDDWTLNFLNFASFASEPVPEPPPIPARTGDPVEECPF